MSIQQDGLNVKRMLLDRKLLHYLIFFPFFLMKSNTYKTTPEVSSQTPVCIVRSVCWEGSKERIERQEQLQLLGLLSTQNYPPEKNFRVLQQWRLQTSKNISQVTCQRVRERLHLSSSNCKRNNLFGFVGFCFDFFRAFFSLPASFFKSQQFIFLKRTKSLQ